MKEPKYFQCGICGEKMLLGMTKHLEDKHNIKVNKTSDLARHFKAVYEEEGERFTMSGNLRELARIIHAAINQEPSKFGLSQQVANTVTVDGIEKELYSFLNDKDKTMFIAKIFDQVFRKLIDNGLVKAKSGRTLTIKDYEIRKGES